MSHSYVFAPSAGNLQSVVTSLLGSKQPDGGPFKSGTQLVQRLTTDNLGITAVQYLTGASFDGLATAINAATGYETLGDTVDFNGCPVQLMVVQGVVGAGTAEVVTGLTVTESGTTESHVTTFTFDDVALAIADNPGVGQHGGFQIYTFQPGRVFVQSYAVDLTITVTSGTLIATYEARFYVAGEDVGPTDGAANSVFGMIDDAVASVQTRETVAMAELLMSTNPAELWFSVFVTDDASHTAGALSVNGTVSINWSMVDVG